MQKGFWLLLITGLLYGSFGIFIRLVSGVFQTFQQMIYLDIVILLILVLLSFIFKFSLSFKKVKIKYLIIYGAIFGFAGVVYTASILNTHIATAVFSLYVATLISSFTIGKLFFKEQTTPKKWVSLLLAFLGLFIFTYPLSKESMNIGMIFGLVAGMFDALGNASNKYLGNKVPVQSLIAARMLGGLAAGALLAVFFRQPVVVPFALNEFFILFLFACCVLAASYTVVKGFEHFDLNLGTIVISVELIFATLFGMFFFKEYPTTNQFIGGLCIFAAVVVAHLKKRQKKAASL